MAAHNEDSLRSTDGNTVSSSFEELLRLRASVERAPVGVAHFDESGQFQFVNQQLCDLFRFSRDELLELTFQDISFPDDIPACLALNHQLAVGAIPKYAHQKRFKRRDGTWIYTRVIVSAVRDDYDRVLFFLGIVEDLSEQWAIDEARRAAVERLGMALDASDTGIYRYDFRRKGLDWANNLAHVFGFPENEELQSLDRLLGAMHPDDFHRVDAAYERSAAEGADFDEEFRVILPDKSVRWICDRARMTLDGNGKAWYLTGACIDVTAQRDAELAREEMFERERTARADAERATRLREELLTVVAHDLRSPLQTIVLGAGAMSDENMSAAERATELQVIQRAAHRMDHLIADLLDVSQIETGRLAVHLAPTDVRAVIQEAIAAHTQRASEHKLALIADIEGNLPPVCADHTRLVQALGNLLGNAIKFSDKPSPIVTAAKCTGGVVEISVTDKGRGIDAGHVLHVFDRYWQAERSRQGVGLGLAIVRGIVEAHGGAVTVTSAPGSGSTFRFTVPIA